MTVLEHILNKRRLNATLSQSAAGLNPDSPALISSSPHIHATVASPIPSKGPKESSHDNGKLSTKPASTLFLKDRFSKTKKREQELAYQEMSADSGIQSRFNSLEVRSDAGSLDRQHRIRKAKAN